MNVEVDVHSVPVRIVTLVEAADVVVVNEIFNDQAKNNAWSAFLTLLFFIVLPILILGTHWFYLNLLRYGSSMSPNTFMVFIADARRAEQAAKEDEARKEKQAAKRSVGEAED